VKRPVETLVENPCVLRHQVLYAKSPNIHLLQDGRPGFAPKK
jgi:hypothetical protein